ncbi:hypothetical protein Sru01_06710 [Sphaerisporangium rufum]|uniref:XRE family transcriptional regulator n=1 Tax=Sphaerisporangium rufum TaxID=1381558 RepID=A0A919UXC5_9ACTN|nr:helix-turn-helix domain-containing protein [Sphaerisporangium rufum]GII75689.1 hypothetical protein Sru01_06710 [Sphaerisporangium rufum]
MAHYFGALVRDLRDSYELRVGHRLTVDRLGARTGYSASMLGSIERGECLPESGTRVQSLDDALHAAGQLKILWPLVQRLGHRPIDELVEATNSALRSYRENGTRYLPQGEDMERRELFQMAALGLFAHSPLMDAGEAVRQLIERNLATTGAQADDWQAVCADHVYAVNHRPPAEARADLLIDIAAIRRALTDAPAERVADLQRTTAWMSALLANVLCRLGEHGGSRRWWQTARHAADASGDRDIQVWVRGSEAVFGLYGSRSTDAVLILARQAQQLAGERVTPGHIGAVCAEAQALAVMGRSQDAMDRLDRLDELAGRSVNCQEFGWTDASVWFTRSWVLSMVDTGEGARMARERTLAASSGIQNDASVRLHEAIRLSRDGGHNEALLLATGIVHGQAPAFRTHMVLHTARMVLDAIPIDKRPALPALGAYQLAISAPLPT